MESGRKEEDPRRPQLQLPPVPVGQPQEGQGLRMDALRGDDGPPVDQFGVNAVVAPVDGHG